jgi:AcrR family transcriptional regulator
MDAESLEALARAEPEVADDPDGRKRRGNATRESILQAAADLASVEGLEGLTIGRLATELNMSKSGLFAHFGSKEDLQLATIDAARRRFVDHVVRPSRQLPRGRARLEALLEDWLRYFRAEVFPGGCFFCNIQAEFDSRPDNAVREAIAENMRQFHGFIEREIRKAQEAGELDPSLDPAQLAFEFDALGALANQHFQLTHDRAIFDRAATGMRSRLKSA